MMSEQMSMLDAEAVTTEAIQRAQDHAEPTWLDVAHLLGRRLSYRLPEWSADDLWRELETHHPDLTTHEPRALGAVIRTLKRERFIAAEPVKYVRSARVQSHLRPIPVHRSLVYTHA